MAPKVKVTSEMVINSALNFMENNDYSSLTVRAVAQELSCSTQPIYSCFSNMDDLKVEVSRLVNKKCFDILFSGVNKDDFVYTFSISLLSLAINKTKLFWNVFISPYSNGVDIFESIKLYCNIHDIFGEQGNVYNLSELDIKGIFLKAYYFILGYSVDAVSVGRKFVSDDMKIYVEKTVREIITGSFLSYGY